jgi:outer membrane protein assembly factor BamB
MKKLFLILPFICLMIPSYGQSSHLYGLWLNNSTQKFVSVDATSGERTEISTIPVSDGVLNCSSAYVADSGQYIFATYDGSTASNILYTIDIVDGTVKYHPENPENTGEYEFDPVTNKLYGLWWDNGTQKFVSVDRVTGDRTEISRISGIQGVIMGSSAFCSDSGQYIFVGYKSSTETYHIYTINVNNGTVKYNPLNPEFTGEYKYDPATNKLYGLWLNGTTQKLVSVDRISGERTEIFNIPDNSGVISGSSAFDADSGRYLFVGFSGDHTKQYLYTIDITDGTVKNKVLNPDYTGEYQIINYVPRISAVKPCSAEVPVEIYPNPLSGNLPLTILENVKRVEILSINGRPVKNYEIENSIEKCTLDLSGISNGIYMIRMSLSSGQVYITKLMINN